MDLSYFLTQIEKIKVVIAKLLLVAGLSNSILGGTIPPLSLDASVVDEPKMALEAQRVDSEGWYIKFMSGEELFVPNALFREIKFLKGSDNAAENEVRERIKIKFRDKNIDWDRVSFFFREDGSIDNVEWRR